jgi:hypothetical protein
MVNVLRKKGNMSRVKNSSKVSSSAQSKLSRSQTKTQTNKPLAHKAIMQSSMISLIVVALVIFILIIGTTRMFPIVSQFGVSNACRVEGLLDTVTNNAVDATYVNRFVQNSNFHSSCPVTTYYLKFSDFNKLSPIDAQRIKSAQLYEGIEIVSEKQKAQFNSEKFVSELLVDCYSRYEGLNIFPATFTVTEMEKTGETGFFAQVKQASRYIIGGSSASLEAAYAPPTFCSMCAKLHFDEEFQSQFASDEDFLTAEKYLRSIDSFRYKDQTLYEVLDSGRYKIPNGDVDVLERYIFTPQVSPYAVVYYQKNDYKMTTGDFFTAATKLLNPLTFAITGANAGLRIYAESEYIEKTNAFLDEQRKLRQTNPIVPVKKDLKLNPDEKILDKGLTTGLASMLNLAHNTYGLYRWFTPSLNTDYAIPKEYGVAIIPYSQAIIQCDFMSNNYGKVQVAKP